MYPPIHLPNGIARGILELTDMKRTTEDQSGATQPTANPGERRLAVAVLEQAFHDLGTASSADRSDAFRWIEKGNVGDLSFDFCCEIIDWNPERIRIQVLKKTPVPRRFRNRASAASRGWAVRQSRDEAASPLSEVSA
jgi:hypothetical protein